MAALETRIKGLESELAQEKAAHSQDVANLKLKIARLVKKLSDGNLQSSRGSQPPKTTQMTQRAPLEEDSMGDLEGILRGEASEFNSGREGGVGTEFDPSNTTPGYTAPLPNASMLELESAVEYEAPEHNPLMPDSNGMTLRTVEGPEPSPPLPDLNGMTQRAIADVHPEPLPPLPNLGRNMFGTVAVTEAASSEEIEDSGRPTLVDEIATREGVMLSIRMGAEQHDEKADDEAGDTDANLEIKKKKKGPEGGFEGPPEGFGGFFCG